eukprot:CAMPEP_0196595642 /NCGR_PEP_ID=MMETSP1081-20130531/81709_1 /TAXON_ID=36882 /ORGANISM="Pyramimonas amylifera, Strain CCMP720" /LENGTH=349 /DNA_ID=CAMNT_0041920285 /DNA_START=47 /DNA_END=1096 /DNA_ORIENTATION=-
MDGDSGPFSSLSKGSYDLNGNEEDADGEHAMMIDDDQLNVQGEGSFEYPQGYDDYDHEREVGNDGDNADYDECENGNHEHLDEEYGDAKYNNNDWASNQDEMEDEDQRAEGNLEEDRDGDNNEEGGGSQPWDNESNLSRGPDSVGAPEGRRMRTPEELAALEALFQENSLPTESQKTQLMSQLGLSEKQFNSWFSHRRQKQKKALLSPPSRGRGRGRGKGSGRGTGRSSAGGGKPGAGRGRGGPGMPRRKRNPETTLQVLSPSHQLGVFGLGGDLRISPRSVLESVELALAAKAEAEEALSISLETLQRCQHEEMKLCSKVELKLPHFDCNGPSLALTFDDCPLDKFEI